MQVLGVGRKEDPLGFWVPRGSCLGGPSRLWVREGPVMGAPWGAVVTEFLLLHMREGRNNVDDGRAQDDDEEYGQDAQH